MEEARALEEERFKELVEVVIDPVRRYLLRRCVHSSADEVLNSTLEVLWRRLGEVPAGSEVAWSVGVARLVLANAERSQRRWRGLLERVRVLDPPSDAVDAVDDGLDGDLARALEGLSPKDAEVLRLWAWDGLEGAELGVALGTSANAAAVRLHRAKSRLAKAHARCARGPVTGEAVTDR